MSKFRFDPKTLGWPGEAIPDVGGPEPAGALEAFVSLRPGIEAIKEIAALADIKWSKPTRNLAADDVDPACLRKDNRDLPD
ncbi:hypothetical protein [Pseudooceanicola sp.]|uniref:hypothetical protein n=1 Tax=Pseudooceanicola sp. TaxID=1914328 RepID=UPI004057E628